MSKCDKCIEGIVDNIVCKNCGGTTNVIVDEEVQAVLPEVETVEEEEV